MALDDRVSRELEHEHYVPQRLMLRRLRAMVTTEMEFRAGHEVEGVEVEEGREA
jgi:hypothetical protein